MQKGEGEEREGKEEMAGGMPSGFAPLENFSSTPLRGYRSQ